MLSIRALLYNNTPFTQQQAQQAKEALMEQQIIAASNNTAEAPVFWLLRYGSKLPEKVLQVRN